MTVQIHTASSILASGATRAQASRLRDYGFREDGYGGLVLRRTSAHNWHCMHVNGLSTLLREIEETGGTVTAYGAES